MGVGRVGLRIGIHIYGSSRVGLRIGIHIYGMVSIYTGRVGLGYVSVSIYTVWG